LLSYFLTDTQIEGKMPNSSFLPVFNRINIDIDHGKGCYLFDKNGKRYLDLFSGLGVNALGHQHKAIQKALYSQINRNLHLSNFFAQDVQIRLMDTLCQTFIPGSRGFFSNSGTEAIEGALKIIKKWALQNNKVDILAMESGFHGRTTGAMSVTMQDKMPKPINPLQPHTKKLIFNDIANLESAVDEKTAAILLEPIQGRGGILPVSQAYIDTLIRLRDKYGFLICMDEIQTGIGRTGKFWAYEHYHIQPDIVTFAKAIGGGLPLGGFLVQPELTEVLQRGDHGSTFGGNPLACAAGLAVMEEIQNGLLDNVQRSAATLARACDEIKNRCAAITSVRGMGLMRALVFTYDLRQLQQAGMENGFLFNISGGGKVLRFLPPLIISNEEIMSAFGFLKRFLNI
jgi:acetylornithine/N-succinyldiaminopimelate aminotransferase